MNKRHRSDNSVVSPRATAATASTAGTQTYSSEKYLQLQSTRTHKSLLPDIYMLLQNSSSWSWRRGIACPLLVMTLLEDSLSPLMNPFTSWWVHIPQKQGRVMFVPWIDILCRSRAALIWLYTSILCFLAVNSRYIEKPVPLSCLCMLTPYVRKSFYESGSILEWERKASSLLLIGCKCSRHLRVQVFLESQLIRQ